MGHKLTIETPDGQPTFMKVKPEQSATLKPGSEKIQLVNGKQIYVADLFMDKSKHVRVIFEPQAEFVLSGIKHTWKEAYIYAPHIKGIADYFAKVAATASAASPGNSKLFLHPAACLQQCNNRDWADDSSASSLRYGGVQCGLTSAAQLITAVWPWEKIKQLADGGQFEDWVAGQFKRLGAQSISMESHVAVLNSLGIPAKAYRDRTLSQLKEDLRHAPVILGFAYKASGHFCTAVGYCDNPVETVDRAVPVGSIGNMVVSKAKITQSGIIYNDPYGRRDWSGSANNWHAVSQTMADAHGLHNFASDEIMSEFWCEPNNNHSGWCVVVDKSVKLLGGATEKAVVLPTAPTGDTIKILADTFLKRSTASASSLSGADKIGITAGTTLPCEVIGASSGHARVKLPDGELWFIFNSHFSGQEGASKSIASNAGRDFCVAPEKLKAAVYKLANPNAKSADLDGFCKAFVMLAPKYTITKREHVIHFLAQCFHESGGLMFCEEIASGSDYDYRDDLGNCRPEAIAAAARAGVSTGRFYKGHSLIQTTGYDNHLAYGKVAGIDAVNHPELLAEYPHALGAALYFWSSRGPSLSVDAEGGINDDTCRKITKVVNGGVNGLGDRLHYMDEFAKML